MSTLNPLPPQQQQVRITQIDAVNILWEETRKISYGAAQHEQFTALKDWVIQTLGDQLETIEAQKKLIAELESAAQGVKEAVLDAVYPVDKTISGNEIAGESKVVGTITLSEPKYGYEPGSGPI